jgi:hypothetical protein
MEHFDYTRYGLHHRLYVGPLTKNVSDNQIWHWFRLMLELHLSHAWNCSRARADMVHFWGYGMARCRS